MKIPKRFRSEGNSMVHKSGGSSVVTIPPNILRQAGTVNGDNVIVYYDGKSQVLIDLKKEE